MSEKKPRAIASTINVWCRYDELVDLINLVPNDKNPNKHPDKQIALLAKIIRHQGWRQPITVSKRSGFIVKGHGRLAAAKVLNVENVPVEYQDYENEAAEMADLLADNRIAELAEPDALMIDELLKDVMFEDFDFELTGFTDADLLPDTTDGLTDEDAVPDVPEEPTSRLGQIWKLGNHRLMCGDSTNAEDVNRLLYKTIWDVCFFDPPYDVEELYEKAMPDNMDNKKLLVMWDFKRFALAPLSATKKGWKPQYEMVWDCVQSWYTPNRPLQRHKSIGVFGDDPFFNTDKAIIKDGKDRGKSKVVHNTRGDSYYTPLDGAKHISTVESFSNAMQNDEHGQGKPVAWIEAIFNGVGGNVVLDLFGGSGTSLIACEKTGQSCFMMELSTKHCDTIINRWEEFTGKKAELIND